MKRVGLLSLLALLAVVPVQAQTGPCTESAIKQTTMAPADDMFSYMPPYGRPVVGKAATQKANAASFSRLVPTSLAHGLGTTVSSLRPPGDMAYEDRHAAHGL